MMGGAQRSLLLGIELWQFAAVAASLCVVTAGVVRTVQLTADVTNVRAETEACIARAVAERHVFDHLAARGVPAPASFAGYESSITVTEDDGMPSLHVAVVTPSRTEHVFVCDLLDGVMPLALVQPLSFYGLVDETLLRDVGPSDVARAYDLDEPFPVVQLDAADGASASAARRRTFARDDSIAISRLRGGTDRPDFVLVPDDDGIARPRFPSSGILILDGNLWIDRDRGAVRIEIDRDATLVVRGNVYVGRSVSLVGDGQLSIVVQTDASRDWSEGSGGVFLGLPEDESERQRAITIDASLVAAGDCLVSAGCVEFAGSLVVGAALRAADEQCRIKVDRSRVPDARVSQPGLRVPGRIVPSRLRPLAPRAAEGL